MVPAYPRKLLEFESREIGEGVHLEIAPERFDGIELRSIRRQQEDMESPREVDELLRDTASMGLGAIPDENDVPWNLILEMPEELANEIAGDVGVGMEPKIEPNALLLRRESQGGYGGDLSMARGALVKERRASSGRPGAANEGSHQKAALIDEHERSSQARGFFLILGHSSLIHRLISVSFRSIARRSGLWGDQPRDPRSLQT